MIGSLFIVGSMILLAQVGVGSTDLLIMGALALSGMGMGTTAPAMAAAIANTVDEQDLGVVGAAQQMMSQVGVVAGIQILQTVQAAASPSSVASRRTTRPISSVRAPQVSAWSRAFFVRSTRDSPERERGARSDAPREVFEPAQA